MAELYYDNNADLKRLKGRTIAINRAFRQPP